MLLNRHVRTFCCISVLAAAAAGLEAQTPARQAPDRAAAYYHFALGHYYAELATSQGNRGEYLNKAIENYRLAIKADPAAGFLSEELSDLYIQAGRIREAVLEAEEALKTNPSDVGARRVLGRIYMRMIGDPQAGRVDEKMLPKAIEQFAKIAELQPDDADNWLLLARLHKIAQNSNEAEKAYKKVLELDKDNEDALTGLAMVYADLGDAKSASETLRRVTDKSPSLRMLTALAGTYEQMRDYANAAETLRKALELSPGSIEIKRAYAQNLLLADRFDEALKLYSEITAEDPKDSQAWLRMSQIHGQRRDFAKAREAAEKGRQADPNNLDLKYNDVRLLQAEGKLPEAIATLKDIIKTTTRRGYSAAERSNRVLLLENLGMMHRAAEQYAEATEAFRQIGELDPELAPKATAQVIETWRVGRDYNKALAESEAAVGRYPNDRSVREARASLFADMGRTDAAAAELKKLLGGKDDRETWIRLAQVYERAKDFGEMEKAIVEAEKLSDSPEEKETIAFMRGAVYEKQKKFDASEAEFRKVLELNPKNASALNYLGYMFADRGIRLPEALELVRRALEIDPDNGAYLDSLGWIYFHMNKLDEAEQYLSRALEKFSKDPTIHDHLGDVYARQGRLKEAIAQWQLALTAWDNSPAVERDPAEVGKVQKKLETARVRLAREASAGPR